MYIKPYIYIYICMSLPGSGIQNPFTICPSHVTSCHYCHLIFIAVCAGAILAFISLALLIAARIIVDKEESKHTR